MSGQPVGFDVTSVITMEPKGAQAPAIIVQEGQTIRLKTYISYKGTPFEKMALDDHLTHNPRQANVVYHMQDLLTGTVLSTIFDENKGNTSFPGATPLTLADFNAALANGELPAGSTPPDPATGYWYSVSDEITTGPGKKLEIPNGYIAGTWRVLVHVHPTEPGQQFAAFDDNLLLEVLK
jgi:hypothetical protein